MGSRGHLRKTALTAAPRPLFNNLLVFSIVITEKGGAQRQRDFDTLEVSIGRLEDNDIVLPKSNVSKRHSRLVLKDGRYIVVDLKSTNGTFVNGRRISAPMVVRKGDKVYIGDYILTLVKPPRPAVSEAVEQSRSFQPSTADYSPNLETLRPSADEGRSDTLIVPLPGMLTSDQERLAPPPPAPEAFEDKYLKPSQAPPRRTAARRESHRPSEPPSRPSEPPSRLSEPPSRLSVPPGRSSGAPSMPPGRLEDPESGHGPATSPAVLTPSVRLQGALHTLMERLGTKMVIDSTQEGAFPSEHQKTLDGLIDGLAAEGVIGPELDRRFLTQAAISEAVGLGPLDRLLNNNAVREIVVDGPSRIMADLGGGLSAVSSFFSSSDAVLVVARRLLTRAGKRLDSGATIQEGLLPNGSQLQLLLPPLSANGPLISVRCPPRAPLSAEGMVTDGLMSMDMVSLLRSAVHRRQNILVVGPVGAGVTTLLGAIASLSQDHERLVTIEDMRSMTLAHPQVLSLSRNASDASLARLLRLAGRLRCDHIVIDDIGGDDTMTALMAATSLRGVLMGFHAPTPRAGLEQLEMFGQASLGGSSPSLATLMAQAIQLLVHVCISKDGLRRVENISEITGARGETLEVKPLFRFNNGFRATEHRAGFLKD